MSIQTDDFAPPTGKRVVAAAPLSPNEEAVERALRSRDQFTPGTRLDSWLFRITRNLWIDEGRSRQRKSAWEAPPEEGERQGFDGAAAIERSAELATVMRAMSALPDDQREVVAAGAAVVTIVGRGPGVEDEVQVCLGESQAGKVQLGEAVRLQTRGNGGDGLSGRVTRLGPQIGELPLRCRRNPAMPEWGREVAVALDEHTPLLPGQAFSVSFLGRPSEHVPAATEPAPLPEPVRTAAVLVTTPTPIDVPPELTARTRFEPSAIAWSASRERFVIASDDTGLPERDEPVRDGKGFALAGLGVEEGPREPTLLAAAAGEGAQAQRLDDLEQVAIVEGLDGLRGRIAALGRHAGRSVH